MSEEIAIRRLQAEDAPELVALFRRCYGETYGTTLFYDAGALAETIAKRRLRSVVATEGGRLVGHTGITIRHPGSLVCETGNTVVDPAARGRGLLARLGGALHGLVQSEGFVGYLHYPTTAHDIMQRASVAVGGRETGVMLAYVSDATEYRDIEQRSGRIAATVAYQPFSRSPEREVFLPRRYVEVIERLYTDLELPRRSLRSQPPASNVRGALIEADHNPVRGTLRLFSPQTGSDLAERVRQQVNEHEPSVTHVDLPLDDPGIDGAVDALCAQGFFFCALLPEFAHTDLLRLQALHASAPRDFEPNLLNADAQRLCAFLLADRAARE